jgi:serine/threonine protein kinase
VDAAIAEFIILACTLDYAFTFENGPIFVVPILGLLLLARAVVVPSRATWTLLLSLPAIPAILSVQLANGNFFADTDLLFPAPSFANLVAWNMVVLLISIGPASDLYALGAVGCYLLSGKPIVDAKSSLGFVNLHLAADPIPPSARGVEVSKELEAALLECLAKAPPDRPESADALREMLLAAPEAGTWSQGDAKAWWEEWDARE